MRRLAASLVLTVVSAVGLSAESPAPATSLEAARKAVRKAKSTSEGRAWERKHSPWLGPAITPTMKRCIKEAPEGRTDEFTIYLRLSSTGNVVESLVEPDTQYTQCFRDGVSQLTYPEVPRNDFWFEIAMHAGPPPRR